MSWTFTNAPSSSTAAGRRDAIRIRIGDLVSTDQSPSDEAITYYLSNRSDSIPLAALDAARANVAALSLLADIKRGKVEVKASQRAAALRLVIAELELEVLTTSAAAPYAGGISVADKDSNRDDTDNVRPAFTVDADIYPGTDPNQQYDTYWRP